MKGLYQGTRHYCHPERFGAIREAVSDEESTCPGVPWKDPENVVIAMQPKNFFKMKRGLIAVQEQIILN